MPFVKLDTGILDSSLWSETAQTCKCWITILAMANAEGFVNATAPGIARRSNLGISDVEKAISLFESTDEHSRSRDEEGRRILRVDGGYKIVNYGKYRDRDYTNAERQKRWRERQKSNGPQRYETVTVTQAEAEAEAEKKKKARRVSRPPVNLEDWLKELEADPTYAKINVRREYGKMCAWCKVRGVTPTQRRFVNWLNKTEVPLNPAHAARANYKRNHAPPPNEPSEAEVERAREIARKETEKLRKEFNR